MTYTTNESTRMLRAALRLCQYWAPFVWRQMQAARADRLRGWAAKRADAATAALNSQPGLRQDWAFITQPGHIPERARMNAADDRAHASLVKAQAMDARADSIDAAADHAIYSDDPDAIEALRTRIANLEARRARCAAVNRIVRQKPRNEPAPAKLAALEALGIPPTVAAAYFVPDYSGRFGEPAYVGQNLSGNIKRNRDRLARLEREAVEGSPWRYLCSLKYAGPCAVCGETIPAGQSAEYRAPDVRHIKCPTVAAGEERGTE